MDWLLFCTVTVLLICGATAHVTVPGWLNVIEQAPEVLIFMFALPVPLDSIEQAPLAAITTLSPELAVAATGNVAFIVALAGGGVVIVIVCVLLIGHVRVSVVAAKSSLSLYPLPLLFLFAAEALI